MKVAQVLPYYSPVIGGVEAICQSISEELVLRGHQVHVLTARRDHKGELRSPLERQETINGVHVSRFRSYGHVGHHAFFPGIVRSLQSGCFDVIHCHGFRQPQSEIGSLVGRRTSTPTILHVHGGFYADTIGKKLHYGAYDALARVGLVNRFDHYVALNALDERRLLQRGVSSDSISVIGNAAEPAAFKAADTSEFRRKHGLEGLDVILYLGILRRHKRPDLLVRALPSILNRAPNAFLLFVGPDEGEWVETERLGQTLGVADRFRWIGPLLGAEKHAAIECAAFLGLPSDEDPYPVVVLEGLAHGKPIVTTNVIGQADVICRANAGLITAPGDVEAIADAASKLLEDGTLRAELSINAKNLAQSKYSIKGMVDKVEALYRKISSV